MKRKTRQVIDRFLFFFFFLLFSVATKYRQVFTKREKKIACLTHLSFSLFLTIRRELDVYLYNLSKIAQCDQFSANHWRRPIMNFVSFSPSLFLSLFIVWFDKKKSIEKNFPSTHRTTTRAERAKRT